MLWWDYLLPNGMARGGCCHPSSVIKRNHSILCGVDGCRDLLAAELNLNHPLVHAVLVDEMALDALPDAGGDEEATAAGDVRVHLDLLAEAKDLEGSYDPYLPQQPFRAVGDRHDAREQPGIVDSAHEGGWPLDEDVGGEHRAEDLPRIAVGNALLDDVVHLDGPADGQVAHDALSPAVALQGDLLIGARVHHAHDLVPDWIQNGLVKLRDLEFRRLLSLSISHYLENRPFFRQYCRMRPRKPVSSRKAKAVAMQRVTLVLQRLCRQRGETCRSGLPKRRKPHRKRAQ